MNGKVRWGLLSTGAIAKAFARGLRTSQTGEAVAVGSRTQTQADAFGDAFEIPHRHGSYEALLADPEVEAVYIATPHPLHAPWAVRAAEAGKHLLVEKPIGINACEAEIVQDAAAANGVFLMEAYMYRCHPQTARLAALLREGAIGEVRVIHASFSFQSGFNAEGRLWNNAMAGGGILDVGGYPVSVARLVAGIAAGADFADPVAVTGAGRLHPKTGVDAWAVGTLAFPGGIVATVATGIGVAQENAVRIHGSEGTILVPNPYVAAREGAAPGRILVHRRGAPEPEAIEVPSDVTSYAHEADVCGCAIRAGRREPEAPAMTWADTLGNLRAQDAWRAAIGLVYESEKLENYRESAVRRPLRLRRDPALAYGRIAHLDTPVARLVMGVDNQVEMPHASAVFGAYAERGGNAFDTAWIYGERKSRVLGRWLAAHGMREASVIIAKGAHTPHGNPTAMVRQIHEQLDWLGVECADLYLMHRDNPEVPAGEFVDALNAEARAGRIRAFGGSNWTPARVDEANAWASARGLQGFSAVSNNLALAEMVKAPWAGCLSVHAAADRQWFADRGIALLPWSSQARGFFVPARARPDLRDDPGLVACWYSEDNFRRQARAVELAERYGVEPVNIALAWVLGQPFETFPLIGPRTLAEVRSCFRALEVKLTPNEMRYLNLED